MGFSLLTFIGSTGLNDILLFMFLISQVGYFIPNLLIWLMLHRASTRYVPNTTPEKHPPVHVFIAAYKERRELVAKTVQNVTESNYPSNKLTTHLVYEPDDPIVAEYIDELDVNPIQVDNDSAVWQWIDSYWGTRMPRNKARALNYAFYTLNLEPDDIIVVFDADTRFSKSLITRCVAGLETNDIVQAKQTVRNIDEGVLPLLESMGMAAWCDYIYAKTHSEAYQLLGKGYSLEYGTLSSLVGWDLSDSTEDMALGVLAAMKGFQLGILDIYVQDLCPTSLRAWVKQKRRWVSGPYRILFRQNFSLRDSLGFQSYTISNQIIAVTNIIGVPSGILMLILFVTDTNPQMPLVFDVIIIFNMFSWAYYSILSIKAARKAVPIERVGKLKYWLWSNPITQVAYAALWSVPILLALYDTLRGREIGFEVTPK